MEKINWDDFTRIELRAGTIVEVRDFPEARKPAYQIFADFGEELGVLKSSAQITRLYSRESLVGRQIIGVVNLREKQVGPFVSQFLVTGFIGESGEVVLAVPERPVKNGSKLL